MTYSNRFKDTELFILFLSSLTRRNDLIKLGLSRLAFLKISLRVRKNIIDIVKNHRSLKDVIITKEKTRLNKKEIQLITIKFQGEKTDEIICITRKRNSFKVRFRIETPHGINVLPYNYTVNCKYILLFDSFIGDISEKINKENMTFSMITINFICRLIEFIKSLV